jgi:hypothetical protein
MELSAEKVGQNNLFFEFEKVTSVWEVLIQDAQFVLKDLNVKEEQQHLQLHVLQVIGQ